MMKSDSEPALTNRQVKGRDREPCVFEQEPRIHVQALVWTWSCLEARWCVKLHVEHRIWPWLVGGRTVLREMVRGPED